ncbi:hypothetical protein EPA93_07145 [Ktedonosporobacter rubrisoli]|uniref:FAD-binding domain-containing protein n=1 Tax=Ktedonosporobacter rubrisoli TaxID=2509675 RepID=A0A4P6JL40_KTERU|nr:FAD-dependent monooxygenase [Ktedonosporobacter rubrisoli]QBD75793.1 hypothetical protein EPA93_07145 [Ktedonosporobacter rubrisoli]
MANSFTSTSQYDEQIPVLIVGGSLVGLSTALFLSWHGIKCLLVERHRGLSPFIRAGGLSPRTMELYRQSELEATIREAASPTDAQVLQVESLVGKELAAMNISDFVTPASPMASCAITQNMLEPILQARARQLGADLRFNTRLISFQPETDKVTALIEDQASGKRSTISARYLIAADGGNSPIRESLGITTQGPGVLSHQANILFSADLSGPLRGRKVLFCHVTNADIQGILGNDPFNARSVLVVSYHPESGEREEEFAGERGIRLIRAAVGVPDLALDILETRSWEMAAFVAERFGEGRVFLVGDSAHVMPPMGGFGANTGIADAHNLAWKLAFVLKGLAGPQLLDTYAAERRPVVQLTVGQALANFAERFSERQTGDTAAPRLDYYTVVLGYLYHSAAVLEGTASSEQYEDPQQPTGRPGSRAPHVMLERAGKPISTLDLFKRNFVLLCAEAGDAWSDAGKLVAKQLGIALDIYRIGEKGELIEGEQRFQQAYGISSTGAVLIRPDGFIGWRQRGTAEHPKQVLFSALSQLLSRE